MRGFPENIIYEGLGGTKSYRIVVFRGKGRDKVLVKDTDIIARSPRSAAQLLFEGEDLVVVDKPEYVSVAFKVGDYLVYVQSDEDKDLYGA